MEASPTKKRKQVCIVVLYMTIKALAHHGQGVHPRTCPTSFMVAKDYKVLADHCQCDTCPTSFMVGKDYKVLADHWHIGIRTS